MLQDIRDRSRGWLAYVIVGVIAVPLVLFGVYNYFTTGGEGPVAEVGDQEISSRQVSNAYQRQMAQLRQMLGENFDPGMIDEQTMRRRALEQLIDQAVLRGYARDAGLRIGDAALGQLIRSQEVFFQDGAFSRERYRQVLAENQLSPEAYEQDLRVRQGINQLQQGLSESVVVTEADLAQMVALERQRRALAFLRVTAKAFTDQVSVSEAEIEAFYQDNQARFQQPERVRLDYVELTMDTLAAQTEISEDELRERYESVKGERFTTPGSRQVSHILLDVPGDAGEEALQAARQKLNDIRASITSGEASFAEMARKHSADPGSAEQGGDLGTVRRGEMVPAFEEAAFALDEGEISEPVRSDFGLHLIKVTGVSPAQTEPFEAVRDQLEADLVEERMANRFYELGSEVANVAYESPDSLQPVAEQFDLEIRTTDWIPRGGTEDGLGSSDAVVEAAFSDEVLEQRYNSQLLELSGRRNVVVRVAAHQPPRTRPLEDVREQIEQALIRRKTSEMAQETSRSLLERLEAGELEMQSVEQPGVSFEDPGMVQRGADGVPTAVLDAAFRLQVAADSAAAYDSTGLSGGDHAVLRVTSVEDGQLAELDEEARNSLRERLRSMRTRAALDSLVATLRAQTEITIHENRL
ncbi:SurA N-terminal domain-containing protein [Ectothiorhodospiraceae bacterium WFHF3C12]|nr:SurA N-terminal domain-containing protein [Ectothiorhodospiraceae bacterium WFHF3C12]